MPRSARIVIPGLPHHIYLRGNNRRRLFSSPVDYARFVTCLAVGLEASASTLHQLTLMSNHVHLVTTPARANGLATMFHRASQRYAQLRNAQRRASGKLFEERYHSKPIVDDAYLMTVTIYNDVNAYRAGRVADPLAHVWSTGPLHAGLRGSRIPRALWTPSPWYLGLGTTPQDRAAQYRQLVAAYLHEPGAALVEGDAVSESRYRMRLERPDRSTAAEILTRWGEKPE